MATTSDYAVNVMDALDAEDARMQLSAIHAACSPHWKAKDRAKEHSRLAEIGDAARWVRERIENAEDAALRPWRRMRSWFRSQGFGGGVKFTGGGE